MIQKIFDKVQFIIGFYSTKRDNLQRQYTHLKEEDMDKFVDESAEKISKILKEEYL